MNTIRMDNQLTFGEAFALARSKEVATFRWRGGEYHTRTREEDEAARIDEDADGGDRRKP